MHEDGTFEINTHHGEDDERMSDQTEGEEENMSEGESSETSEDKNIDPSLK